MPSAAPPVEGSDWITCPPIDWATLSGRAVVIVFWSFGCEASLIRIRQIEALVTASRLPVTAIAVHTPRFPYEDDLDAVRSAVTQHQIAIPVVHDPEYLTWTSYNPDGWPATVVVDARGRVLGVQVGTDDLDLVTSCVDFAVKSAPPDVSGATQVTSVPRARPLALPSGPLAFPTSVTVRSGGDLAIVDSANNRVLVVEPTADLRRAKARAEISGFLHPYGIVATRNDSLVVSEPSIGRVSHLDLGAKSRKTLTEDLVAPTGLCLDRDGSVVVADTGADRLHRIIDEGGGLITLGVIAGSGSTGTADGRAGAAELAQPMGVVRTEAGLVFCDAASSNIRLLTDGGSVVTVTGNGLFDWGLVDGPVYDAMLQRPSALAVRADGSIVVIDTGNHRLRHLANRRLRTLGLAGLSRPSGVAALESGHLIVCDTGNSRLVVVDPTLSRAWPLELEGVTPADDPTPPALYAAAALIDAESHVAAGAA